VLVRREGLDEKVADEVARRLDGISQDVRDAIRVARLAPQLGIDKAIKLLLGGDSNEK
jgi:Holliday junction DNA helicase RuvB